MTVQRELAKDFTAQAAFVSTKAIRHTDDININPAGPGGGVAGQYYYPITGQTTAITESTPFSTSNYDALQTQIIKRLEAERSARLTPSRRRWISAITTTPV